MNFKRFLGTTLAVGAIFTAFSAVNVFAAPTLKIGQPVDVNTGDVVTEYKAGQVVEVPIDVENVDSGKLSMMQIRVNYDNTVFEPGATAASIMSYYSTNKDYVAISNKKLIGRHNMKADDLGIGIYEATGVFSGNTAAEDDGMALLWTIDGADSIDVNADEAELYALFTVKSDFVPSEQLNYGSSSQGDGLFTVRALYVDETTTINHKDLAGTQNNAKLNKCFGAFKINVDTTDMTDWIQAIYVSIDGGAKQNITEYVTTDDVVYNFPVRITADKKVGETVNVVVLADVTADKEGTTESSVRKLANFDLKLDSPNAYVDQAASNN